jgi:DNA-directed RNA polymerase sigma subunit (sigma70/sigma32)
MERKEAIIKLKEEGKTYQEIGDTFNLSRQRIHQIITIDKGHLTKVDDLLI